jgi:uncharacterized membrane protein
MWIATRGFKRHAGSVLVIIPAILQMFGVTVGSEDLTRFTEVAGGVVWVVGWIDALIRARKGK